MKKLLLVLLLATLSTGCDTIGDVIDELDPEPNLNLAISNASAPVIVDEQAAILVTASNEGEVTAEDAVVRIGLPQSMYSFADPSGAGCVGDFDFRCNSGEELEWSLGALEPGESRTLTFPISPDASNRTFTLSGTLNATNADGVAATTSFRSIDSGLQVALTSPNSDARAGAESELVVSYVNDGAPVNDATLSLTLPSGFEVVAAEGGSVDGRRVRWELGTVATDDTEEFFVRVLVPSTADVGQLREAEVAVSGSSTSGEARYTFVVAPRDRITVSLSADQTTIASDGQAAIVVQARNRGGTTAEGAVVNIILPQRIFSFADPGGAGCTGDFDFRCNSGEELSWSLGNLEAGQSRTLTFPIGPDGARGPLVLGAIANADNVAGTAGSLALTVDR